MNLSDRKIAEKTVAGKTSRKNAVDVVNWFSSSADGHQTLSDMMDRDSYLMEEEIPSELVISPITSDRLLNTIQKQIRRKKLMRHVLQVAAIVLPFVLLVSVGVYLNRQVDLFNTSDYAEVYIPKGESGSRILFQDGSEVYLNADTRLRYPKKFGLKKRKVYLQGEAYFNVASNSNRPFFVHTENSYVKVLGTSFNVKAYDTDPEISVVLDEGKVTFNAGNTEYAIRSGHEIVYNRLTSATSVNSLPTSSVKSLWKQDIIYLKDTPLAEVIATLERKYDVKFQVENPAVYNYTYTLVTKHQMVDSVLLELEKITPVKFNRNAKIIHVTL